MQGRGVPVRLGRPGWTCQLSIGAERRLAALLQHAAGPGPIRPAVTTATALASLWARLASVIAQPSAAAKSATCGSAGQPACNSVLIWISLATCCAEPPVRRTAWAASIPVAHA